MKKLLIVSTIGLALASGSAVAADLPLKTPAPVVGWTGCYVDGGIGYGLWNQKHYAEFDTPFTAESPTVNTGGEGWLGRAGGGCDFQIGSRWVVGAFGDYDFTSLSGQFDEPFSDDIGSEKERYSWAVGGRVGYLITPSLLGFLDAGYTRAAFSQISLSAFSSPPLVVGAASEYIPAHTYSGWFLGGGYEYALSGIVPIPGLFWRTEYRYSDYKGADLPILTLAGAPVFCDLAACTEPLAQHMQKDIQTVTSGLVWRFNWH
jgi:outer membrane immunogenic protein